MLLPTTESKIIGPATLESIVGERNPPIYNASFTGNEKHTDLTEDIMKKLGMVYSALGETYKSAELFVDESTRNLYQHCGNMSGNARIYMIGKPGDGTFVGVFTFNPEETKPEDYMAMLKSLEIDCSSAKKTTGKMQTYLEDYSITDCNLSLGSTMCYRSPNIQKMGLVTEGDKYFIFFQYKFS